jgi:hypothetical protein
MPPVKYAGRNYVIELAVVMSLYIGLLYVRPVLLAHTDDPTLDAAIKLLPILPIWLMFAVVWRHYRRIDEYDQKKFLETLAISFGIGSCLVVSYAFLMDVGLPQLAITWAWPTLAITWGLTSGIRGMVSD